MPLKVGTVIMVICCDLMLLTGVLTGSADVAEDLGFLIVWFVGFHAFGAVIVFLLPKRWWYPPLVRRSFYD